MIRDLRPRFPKLSIHRMAQLLGIGRSTVYEELPKKDVSRVLSAIEHLVVLFMGYGYRRVTRALVSQGFSISEYAVRKLMREHGLLARRPKSKSVTATSRGDKRAGNLLKGLKATGLDQVWVADTTLIRTDSGGVYLAAILDLYSRKVVSWHLSRRNDEELVRSCLAKALEKRKPAMGWIHHSDQGSPYTATGYVRLIRDSGGRASYSGPGKPQENAHMESFFRTLKVEEVHRNRYADFLEVDASMTHFMDTIYNSQRMHSALEYMSPDQFESRCQPEPREGVR